MNRRILSIACAVLFGLTLVVGTGAAQTKAFTEADINAALQAA
jgi:hypothetical protein